ncbi:MAG: hypothetical protein EU549_04010, partial [Promethearchaeota archaeon]
NNALINNSIANISGGSGGTGGYHDSGGVGGIGAGIHLSASSNNTLAKNFIADISGGNGGAGGDLGSGGDNGIGYGLYVIANKNIISNNIFSDSNVGIYLDNSDYTFISDNNCLESNYGLYLYASNYTEILDNFCSNNTNGIKLSSSNNNTISDNICSNNTNGIQLDTNSNMNNILGNNFSYNNNGIYAISCQHNNFTENILGWNDNCGINFTGSTANNLVYNNILFNNSINGWDDGINNWDDGSIGNYWDDYTGIDSDFDGIGDSPYNINGTSNRKDYYPIIYYNPIIFKHPSDITYEFGDEGYTLNWTVINMKPDLPLTFNVFRDGACIMTGKLLLFMNEIIINVDNLELGTHGYSLEVQDEEGGTRSDGVEVEVINIKPVFISNPADLTYEAGSANNNLSWIFFDNSTNDPIYTLTRDGIPVLIDEACESGTYINVSVDRLLPGNYIYTITIKDGFGKSKSDIVLVEVTNNAPNFTETPSDASYEINNSHYLIWTFSDISTDNAFYNIMRDGEVIISDQPCSSNTPIYFLSEGLPVGTYIYSIEINDGYGKSKSDSVSVGVTNFNPTIFQKPSDTVYQEGSTNFCLQWTFSDFSTDNAVYTIRRDGIIIISDEPCSSGVPITISIDGLPAGIYTYSIEIDDGYGGIDSDIVSVKVLEAASSFSEKLAIFSPIIIAASILVGSISAALFIGFFLRKRLVETPSKTTQREEDLKKIKKTKKINQKKDTTSKKTSNKDIDKDNEIDKTMKKSKLESKKA